ncbi:hypothetical protein DESUT3_30910 [Desulfuromonas versatilis]|uniref:DUF2007 domain-containing protein n=1 Tax=Desulfuromonas versatilis TaxID=2802975 RepID=A0ABN6E1I2_9BACT|nr:DUF2007 domain-containing protein [Desulfuromonas versatilis]BCR06022.1 hypothetical protein DESUT3_30910 [Desulfuromonas versatilis]
MRKLRTFSFNEGPLAGLLKGLLEGGGVRCVIRNERLFTAIGEIPFTECYPELWVLDDEDFELARRILAPWDEPPPVDPPPWVCAGCGETVDGHLQRCWNCGSWA